MLKSVAFQPGMFFRTRALAVRDHTKTIDLPQVNTVLLQPHWRHNQSNEPTEPVLIPPYNLPPR